MNTKQRKDDCCTYFLDELGEKQNKRIVRDHARGQMAHVFADGF